MGHMVYRKRCNHPSGTNPLHRMSMKKIHQLVLIVSSQLQEMRCRLVEVKYRTVRHPVRKSNPETRVRMCHSSKRTSAKETSTCSFCDNREGKDIGRRRPLKWKNSRMQTICDLLHCTCLLSFHCTLTDGL